MVPVDERCCKRIMKGFHHVQCQKQGYLWENGKRYCYVHFPPNAAKRDKERRARWDAESAADARRYALRDAAAKIVEAALGWYDEVKDGPGAYDDPITRACRRYRELEGKKP